MEVARGKTEQNEKRGQVKQWKRMGYAMLLKLMEIGFKRVVQSVEVVKEKKDAGGQDGK